MKDKKTQSRSQTSSYSKTRYINIDDDRFDEKKVASQEPIEPVVGWLVIVGGYGMGRSFELRRGLNEVGKGKENNISLDFGDEGISDIRDFIIIFNHIKASFLIQSGSNDSQIALNGEKMYYFDELSSGDTIKVGSTTMKFISFCNDTFTWDFDKLS